MDVLQPGVVGVADGRYAEGPARVFAQAVAAPVGDVEGRVGEDVVEAQVAQLVLVEAAFVVPADVGVDAAHGQVHLGQAPGGVVALLAVDGDVADAPAVFEHELFALHEHAATAAAGVVDAALVGFEHLHQHLHHRMRGVELAAALALAACELAEEVFVDAAEQVVGLSALFVHGDAGDQVDQLAQHQLVQRRAGVVLGQHALQGFVVLFDGAHGVVDQGADLGALGIGLQVRPARVLGHPEHVVGQVFVPVLGGLRIFG